MSFLNKKCKILHSNIYFEFLDIWNIISLLLKTVEAKIEYSISRETTLLID
nr:MAG TPA: hypothetical protein [Caudoviricetes sp.]